jgi:CHASE2 domain-containing sensor protein/tRNA A-37 threonylcarbamoyl transferase component Bud32
MRLSSSPKNGLRRRRRQLLLVAVGLLAAAIAGLAQQTHLLRRLEQQSVDVRFQVRGSKPPAAASKVVLVEVDNSTFNYLRNHDLPARWPFPRRDHARVIDQLRRAGAKVIGFDVQFSEESDRRDDNALIRSVGRAGNVVLSTTVVEPDGNTPILGGNQALDRLGARVGNTSLALDSDGVVRGTQYSIAGLRTFGVVAAEADTGRPVPASLFGGPRTPVPIDYAGPPGTFRSVPYWRVLTGRFPPGLFKGKIVIVGASAESLQDLHQTAVSGTPMPGPELLANTTATVLSGIPLRQAPTSTTILLILLLALLVPLAGMRLGTIGVLLVGAGVLVAWSLTTQIAFDAGSQLDYVDPLAALALATFGTVLVGLAADSRERRRLRTLFAADSEGVVADVLGPAGERPLEPTAIIAGYRIEEPIGRGGMGVVYRATQEALGRDVAVKLIVPEHGRDPAFRERFKLESRLAAAIEHVNVIPVYEAGEDDELLFIAMRLVHGTDLAAALRGGRTLEPRRTALLIGQLAGALDAAHAAGLVHRDVKPANVLLTGDAPEHVYLTDFGIAKSIGGGGVTAAEGWAGTLDYLAPEQIRGEEIGAGVDIYALAGVLYQCLTGEVPFPRDSDAAKLWAHLNAPPPAPSERCEGLPSTIDAVVARAMAKDPGERYPTAGELARACAAALEVSIPQGAGPLPPLAPRPRPPLEPDAPTVTSD